MNTDCRDAEDCPSRDCKGKESKCYKPPLPLDILATLADFIPKINQIFDQLHAKSLELEDKHCQAGDKANDIYEDCRELEDMYAKIVNDEFQQEG